MYRELIMSTNSVLFLLRCELKSLNKFLKAQTDSSLRVSITLPSFSRNLDYEGKHGHLFQKFSHNFTPLFLRRFRQTTQESIVYWKNLYFYDTDTYCTHTHNIHNYIVHSTMWLGGSYRVTIPCIFTRSSLTHMFDHTYTYPQTNCQRALLRD